MVKGPPPFSFWGQTGNVIFGGKISEAKKRKGLSQRAPPPKKSKTRATREKFWARRRRLCIPFGVLQSSSFKKKENLPVFLGPFKIVSRRGEVHRESSLQGGGIHAVPCVSEEMFTSYGGSSPDHRAGRFNLWGKTNFRRKGGKKPGNGFILLQGSDKSLKRKPFLGKNEKKILKNKILTLLFFQFEEDSFKRFVNPKKNLKYINCFLNLGNFLEIF